MLHHFSFASVAADQGTFENDTSESMADEDYGSLNVSTEFALRGQLCDKVGPRATSASTK